MVRIANVLASTLPNKSRNRPCRLLTEIGEYHRGGPTISGALFGRLHTSVSGIQERCKIRCFGFVLR